MKHAESLNKIQKKKFKREQKLAICNGNALVYFYASVILKRVRER